MISIRTYLERLTRDPGRAEAPGPLSAALRQALRMLIAGLPFEPVPNRTGHGGEAAGELLKRLDEARHSFDVLEVADEAPAALERDARAARARHRAQSEELQAMISMLTETVASISVHKDSSVARLQQIERVSLVEDMRALKTSLSECLAAVREAALQQQVQATESIQRLESQIRSSKAHLASQPPPPAEDSDLVLSDEPEPRESGYAAVFLLDRADLIARRYGESVRSEVLAFVRQHFKRMLMPNDRSIRWNSAAFVVLLQRTGTADDVSAELRSLASLGRSQYFDVGDRSVLLDTSLTWTVFPQADFASPDLFFKAVEDFIRQSAERQAAQTKSGAPVRPIRNTA